MRLLVTLILATLCAGGWTLSPTRPALPVAAASVGASTPGAHEELTLRSLGLETLTTTELDSTVDVFFPPPGAPLAARGSFVRVYFAHSSDAGPGSVLMVSVNGQTLTTVSLGPSTAFGAVFEVTVPASILNSDSANVFQAHFKLERKLTAGTFARVDSESLIHYQLVGEGERALSLSAYPYSLLMRRPDLDPSFEVVLPASPDPDELGATWQLLADLGRRAGARRLSPRVLTAGAGQLQSDGVPRLLIGQPDRIPDAHSLLQMAGFSLDRDGLRSGSGSVLRPSDGLVVAMGSPADAATPVVLVTGSSDAALRAGASALVHSDTLPLAGSAAVVAGADQRRQPPRRQVNLISDLRRDMTVAGNGEHQLLASFQAPAADPAGTGHLALSIRSSGLESPTRRSASAVIVAVNGHILGTVTLDFNGPARTEFLVPGIFLVAGRNSINLDFRVDSGPSGRVEHSVDSASITLPGPPGNEAGLLALPYPYLDGPASRATMVVVHDTGAATLTGAASSLVALGSRSVAATPEIESSTAGAVLTSRQADANLIVVGASGPGQLTPIGQSLKLSPTSPGAITGVRPGEAVGSLETIRLPGQDVHLAIWVGGTSSAAVIAAGAAIYERDLRGSGVLVDQSGLPRSELEPGGTRSAAEPLVRQALKLLIAGVIVVMVVLFALSLRRRDEDGE